MSSNDENPWTEDTAPIVVLPGDRNADRVLRPAIERAQACFAAAAGLHEITVCGEVIGTGDFGERRMPVPFINWSGRAVRDFDFGAEVHINHDFAIHASRFQATAIPADSSNVLAAVMSIGQAPFTSSILHIARSGHVRLLKGALSDQLMRFLGKDEPDFSGIRPVFIGEPTAHELIEAYGQIARDLRSFNRNPKA